MNKKLVIISSVFAILAVVSAISFYYLKPGIETDKTSETQKPPASLNPEQQAIIKASQEYNIISSAMMNMDDKQCEKIGDAIKKDQCISQVAIGKADAALCEKIASTTAISHCKEQIIFNKIYENNKDIKNCKQFNFSDLRRMCYAKIYAAWDSESKCNELEEEYRADCRNQVRRRAAFAAKDPDKCKTLTGDAYQEECRKSIENLPKDSDGDGLNDPLEMSIATDPNKRDTDGDGVGDMQEILKKTDPKDRKSK